MHIFLARYILGCFLVFGACSAVPELPLVMYMEDDWSLEQQAIIRRAFDEINEELRPIYGEDVVSLADELVDAPPFDPYDDLPDGQRIIYKMRELDASIEYLEGVYGNSLLGWAANDMLLGDFIPVDEGFDQDEQVIHNQIHVIKHEFGHLVGLFHKEQPGIIMHPRGSGAASYRKEDKEMFCIMHRCVMEDIPEDAPEVPSWYE